MNSITQTTNLAKLVENSINFLAHSFWLGILLGLVYFFLVKKNQRLNPSAKVRLGMILMGVLPLLAIAAVQITELYARPKIDLAIPLLLATSIILLWLIVVIGLTVRMIIGFSHLRTIRNSAKRQLSLDKNWINDSNPLPEVRVGERSREPQLIGQINPVIYIPTALSQDRKNLEPIVLHEVAHWKRGDHWGNFFQSLFDTIIGCHPFMNWLSFEIRKEREHACDDLAVELMRGDRFRYASALLSAEEMRDNTRFALTFGADGSSTSDRASRIAFGETRKNEPLLGWLAATCLLSVVAIYFALFNMFNIFVVGSPVLESHPAETIEMTLTDPGIGVLQDKLKKTHLWRNGESDGQELPLFKSVPILERDGIVYNLANEKPRLFDEFPNSWVEKYQLNYEDRRLPWLDSDGDLFTNKEEFEAKTNPNAKDSHPDPFLLLKYVDRKYKLYQVQYAAQPDQKTIQLKSIPTAAHPKLANWYLKVGDQSADGKVQLRSISSSGDQIQIRHNTTKKVYTISKRKTLKIPSYYAELEFRTGEKFYVKEGSRFKVPKFGTVGILKACTEDSAILETLEGKRTSLIKK